MKRKENLSIMDLPSPNIVKRLYDTYYVARRDEGEWVSSHWRKCGSRVAVEIDENGVLKRFAGSGFGDLESRHILERIPKYLCNLSYQVNYPYKEDLSDLSFLMQKARQNLKRIDWYISYSCFRQICSLSAIRRHLGVNERERFDILLIGDGYGFLSSLLKSVYPGARITLVDIGRVLLFQAVNVQKVHQGSRHLFIDDGKEDAGDSDFLYVPAENVNKIGDIRYKLAVNIASMMEMNYETINAYFKFLRSHATEDNLFYCCNRERKTLSGGEVIEFSKYPWHPEDRHLIDEECPFYKYHFSWKVPFVHKFEGPFIHRLTKLNVEGDA